MKIIKYKVKNYILKKYEDIQLIKKLLDNRQAAIKLFMNVVYGFLFIIYKQLFFSERVNERVI